MAEWSIYPCDGVEVKPCRCYDGKFTLSQNVPLNKEFVITYKNGNSTQTINYKRKTECYTCRCDKIAFKWRQIEIPMSDWVLIKNNNEFNVEDHLSQYEWLGNVEITDPTCKGKVEISGGTDHEGEPYFTDIKIEEGTNKVLAKFKKFKQYVERDGNNIKPITGRLLYFDFIIRNSDNSTITCAKYHISQQAWRGTDNGVSLYADGREDNHPIFFGYYGTADEENNYCVSNGAVDCNGNRMGCTQSVAGSYEDDDSITSKGNIGGGKLGAWYYDQTNHTYTPVQDGFSTTIDGWLTVSYKQSNATPCTFSMVKTSVDSILPTISDKPRRMKLGEAIRLGHARKASFLLTSVPDLTANPLNPVLICETTSANRHPGEECAIAWRYDVVQIPKGYYLCYSEEIEGNPDEYDLLLLGEKCGCSNKTKINCKCK